VLDRTALEALFKQHAPFDILISAATGGTRAMGPFLDMNMDGYKASFDKLWGYANVVRYGASHLGKDGAIVLVSGAPARKCRPGQVSLSSVGASVEALVRAVAPEIAPRRINVVSPGSIDTPILALKGAERETLYKNITAKNLIPRAGKAEEVAQAIVFLVQNDFVTGTTIDVDGGWLLS
jgi:NAD(P)-dependent dehydrogenase (short-subunit alcohol dehydrogenase family)